MLWDFLTNNNYVCFVGSNGFVKVKYTEDNQVYQTKLDDVENVHSLQIGDRRDVKFTDGKFYKARIIEIIGNVKLN